jgi:signal transduction histidine kinase
MTLLSSLQSRIFLTSALVAVLSIGTALYLVSVRVTREFEDSLQREMRSTGTLVEQLRTTRAQTFAMMARLIADTPKLKAAVDTNDPATVQDNASDYQAQLQSNLLIVTNKTGQVLATVGATPRTALVVASQPAVRDAIAGKESLSLIPQPGGLLHLVSVPITLGLSHPDILGALSVGFLLDDDFAHQLREMTGSEIAFGMDGQILASTLPREQRATLSSALRSDDSPGQVMLGAEEYVTLALPLTGTGAAAPDPDSGPVALILRSRTDQLRFLQEIRTGLTITAVLVVSLATLLSFAVARTITRPLAAITGVMREVAATGDLTRKILLNTRRRWDDEDARLLATTFNTLTDSVARAQREMSHRERLSSLGRLSTVIAHEVRNPLMIIKAALHTLRSPDLDPAAVREAAADIDEEVVRLNRIVNDVLDFARPIRFELAPTDLNALCRESAAAAQVTPGPAVDVQVDPALPTLMLDAERLRMALVNLIVNARHAAGARQGRVTIRARREQQNAVILVEDQGGGIAPADLPHVFDPYFTTRRGGTGLGLPITKNIVEGLGGTIEVRSPSSGGTQILLTFPIETAPLQAADASVSVAAGAQAPVARQRHAV